MDKRQLRKMILEKRDHLSAEERKKGDILVAEKVLGHQWYYGAENLLLFVSYGSEIDTKVIMEEALRQGKKVYVPRVEGKDMNFYQIMGQEQLQEGYRKIMEPIGNTPCFQGTPELEKSTLMIMPGTVFDKYRNRIGYGGGFYDRYLQDKPWMRTIAIGYRCQMVDEIPCQDFDIRPGQIICL